MSERENEQGDLFRLRKKLLAGRSANEAEPQPRSAEDFDAHLRTCLAERISRIQGRLRGVRLPGSAPADLRLQLRHASQMCQLSMDLTATIPAMIIVGDHIQMHSEYVMARLSTLNQMLQSLDALDVHLEQLNTAGVQEQNARIDQIISQLAKLNSAVESL